MISIKIVIDEVIDLYITKSFRSVITDKDSRYNVFGCSGLYSLTSQYLTSRIHKITTK